MHDEKILLWGMSCVGKTTFARRLTGHTHYSFDALYPWHLIETLGLSVSAALDHVSKSCTASRYVLDGWNLADPCGTHFPEGVSVYVLYAPYHDIVAQYRKSVPDPEEYRPMFAKWYSVDFSRFPGVRFIKNTGDFKETSLSDFDRLVSDELAHLR